MTIYEKIFKALNEAQVKYLVVGGVAVNLYGYLRVTADIDIVMALDEENLEKLDQMAKKLGYYPRIPVELKMLNDEKRVKEWMKTKNFKAYTLVHSTGGALQIDIIIEESLKFNTIYPKRVNKKISDIEIPLISLDDLLKMKRKANREKDLQDIENLLLLKGL